jgi:two-component sensor histidine kinase
MVDAAAGAGIVRVVAQDAAAGAAVALIESWGLLAALGGLIGVMVWGTGLPRVARLVLAGVLLLALATHFWAVVEWTTALRMDQYVDLARVVTPIMWMFFMYALSGEMLREKLRREEQRRVTMMRELDHRVKNNLTAVIAMAEQTFAWSTDLNGFMRAFLGRVRALGRAHEALAASRWEGIGLEEIVRITLEPFEGPRTDEVGSEEGADVAPADTRGQAAEGGRIRVAGEHVTLPARVSSAVCMTLHELATNAAKYGALSSPDGRVSVGWSVGRDGRADAGAQGGHGEGRGTVRLTWSEEGGPRVTCGRQGLGTGLIKGIIEYELGGRVELEMAAEGVRCVLEVPMGELGGEFGQIG